MTTATFFSSKFFAAQWGISHSQAKRELKRMGVDGRVEVLRSKSPRCQFLYRMTGENARPVSDQPNINVGKVEFSNCRIIINISRRGRVTAKIEGR